MSILTSYEVSELSKRISEISDILELCDAKWDDDVICNLELELECIEERLEESLKLLQAA